jgi:soluble lytic murein transglycosylase-like protein
MTVPLTRAAVQRLIDPPTVRRSAALPTLRSTFASVLTNVQGRPASATTPQVRTASASASQLRPSNVRSSFVGLSPTTSLPANRLQQPLAPTATGLDAYKDLVQATAHKYGIQPELLAAVAQTESGFNPKAQSQAGAKGLMQLMDGTARGLGITDSFDPAQSLDGGARFLSGLLKEFDGDVRLALAAYNAGPVAVKKYGGVPPYQETQRYVPKVLAQADAFRRLFGANLPALESS